MKKERKSYFYDKLSVERPAPAASVEDNELARYLNRDYWENRKKEQQQVNACSFCLG